MFDFKNKSQEVAKVVSDFETTASKAADDAGEEFFGKEQETVEEAVDDFKASAAKLEELRAGRGESDIPLHDEYWEYRNAHTLTHGKHAVRVDETQLVKGKPVDRNKLVVE